MILLSGVANIVAQVGDKPLKDISTKTQQGFEIAKESLMVNNIEGCCEVYQHESSGFISCQRQVDLILYWL